MATYASVQDVQVELGRQLATEEAAQVTAWLERAEALIRSRIPDLDDRVGQGLLSPALVASIEAAAVARKVNNPSGVRTQIVRVDDASVQKTMDGPQSGGAIFLLPDEWDLLLPNSSGAFTVRTPAQPSTVRPAGWPFSD